MKIVLSSDLHIDAVTAGVERMPELNDHVDELVAFGKANPGSSLVVMGDYFDPGGRRDVVYAAWIIQACRRLREAFERTIWLAGNHDVLEMTPPESGWPHTTLSPLHDATYDDDDVQVVTLPYWTEWGTGDESIHFVGLPFVASAVRRHGDDLVGRMEMTAFHSVRNRITTLTPRGQIVVAGHRTIAGIVPGSETEDMPRGGDYPFPEAALQLYRDFPGRVVLANGHYHEPQVFSLDGCPIVIPGCPFRATFGELGGPDRGFVVIDTDAMTPGT